MRAFVTIGMLALTACASCPAPPPQTQPPPQSESLSVVCYGLAGRVNSLLADGKLTPARAIQLDSELQVAEADLRSGQTAAAQKIIDSVKGELP